MYCVHCGKKITDEVLFCPFCGKPLKRDHSGQIEKNHRYPGDDRLQNAAKPSESRKNTSFTPAIIIICLCAVAALVCSLKFLVTTSSQQQKQQQQQKQETDYAVEFDDTVLYNKNDITIIAKGFEDKGDRGGRLIVEVQNDSSIDIGVVATSEFTVNGYGISFIGTSKNGGTPAGETRIHQMDFEDRYLEPLGINKVYTLDVVLYIDELNKGILDVSDPVELIIREGSDDSTPTGDVIFDESGIKILYQNYTEGTNFYEANFYIENNADFEIQIKTFKAAEETYTEGHSYETFAAGAKRILSVTLLDDDYEFRHDKLEYMLIDLLICNKETGEIIGNVGGYRVDL